MRSMSEAAEKALLSAEAGREGARLTGAVSEVTYAELAAAGLIGARRGLTVRGVVKREGLREAMLEAAF